MLDNADFPGVFVIRGSVYFEPFLTYTGEVFAPV
jgi:hypothetical protein